MEGDGEMIKNDSRGKNMVKGKYFKGIAILVLILGMLSVSMAITIDPPSSDQSANNVTGDPARIFTITISGNSTVKWYVNGTLAYTDPNPNATTSSYTNSTFKVGVWNVTAIATNSTNANDSATRKWLWTVTAPSPPVYTAPTITPSPTAIAFDTSANISFNVNQSNANTTVRYGISSLDSGSLWQNGSSYGSSRNILLTGLTPGIQYIYSVFAYNASNSSLFSNSTLQTFTTRNPTRPNITSVTNDGGSTSSINFTVAVNQTDAYIGVKYGETESLELPFVWKNTSGSPRTIKLYPLASGTKYYYIVYAVNQTNQTFSSNTTIQNFTTKYPGPTIGSIVPPNTSAREMTTGESTNLSVTIGSQSGNLSWYENNNTFLNSTLVNAFDTVNYTFSRSTKGTYTITANVSNENGSDTRVWTINVHPTTFSTGNRIWDGSKPNDFGLTYTWTPQSFSGFYYNAKDDVGTENITITMDSYSSRTIGTNDLLYSTSPQEVSFTHSAWGKYQVIGFMADKYFAGYTCQYFFNKYSSDYGFQRDQRTGPGRAP